MMITELAHAARKIGHALAQWSNERRFDGRQLGTQFKAEVDQCADALWRKALQSIAPGAPIVSEEDDASHAMRTEGNYWLIDPLDGTASFVGGFPGWVTQVAWMERHRPTKAVVFAPRTDELFQAEIGQGAFLNGKLLTVDSASPIQSLVDNYPEPRGIAAAAMKYFGIKRYVESGSIGLKICRVAAGQADVFVKDVAVKNWDIAPGNLILNEAGGTLTGLDGTHFEYNLGVEHTGLISSRSQRFAEALTHWAKSRESLIAKNG